MDQLYKEKTDYAIALYDASDIEKDEKRKEIAKVLIIVESMNRNRRCALAYLKHRMDKIEALRWEVGTVLPKELRSNLKSTELNYFKQYNNVLGNYMRDIDFDLTSGVAPPKDLFVEVLVLENCGEIYTDHGPVRLDASTTHYLRLNDVEHLIRQGKLKQLSSTDS